MKDTNFFSQNNNNYHIGNKQLTATECIVDPVTMQPLYFKLTTKDGDEDIYIYIYNANDIESLLKDCKIENISIMDNKIFREPSVKIIKILNRRAKLHHPKSNEIYKNLKTAENCKLL